MSQPLSGMMKRKLSEKLSALDASMEKITGLSKMMALNYHKSQAAVALWWEKFQKSSPHRYLTFVYVANDIMQNTKRTGTSFIEAFCAVMGQALCITVARVPKLRPKIDRLIQVWGERKVIGTKKLQAIRAQLSQDLSHIGPAPKMSRSSSSSSHTPRAPVVPPPSPGTPPGTPPPECVARSRLLLQSLHPNQGINMDAVLGEDEDSDEGSSSDADSSGGEEEGQASGQGRKRKRRKESQKSDAGSSKRRRGAHQETQDNEEEDEEEDDGGSNGLVDALVYNEAVEGMIHTLVEQFSQVEPDLLQLQQTLPGSLVKGSEMEASLRRRILANAGVLKQLKHELTQKEERNNAMVTMIGHEINQQLEYVQQCDMDIKTINESLDMLSSLKKKHPNQKIFKLKRKKNLREEELMRKKKTGNRRQRVMRDDLKHVNDDDKNDASKKNLPKDRRAMKKKKKKKKKSVPMVWNRALRAYVPVNVDGSEMRWREH